MRWQIALWGGWHGQAIERDDLAPCQPVGEASARFSKFAGLPSRLSFLGIGVAILCCIAAVEPILLAPFAFLVFSRMGNGGLKDAVQG
jgi:hypothetical protein